MKGTFKDKWLARLDFITNGDNVPVGNNRPIALLYWQWRGHEAYKPCEDHRRSSGKKKPPICTACMPPNSLDAREIITYACFPTPIMLLLQKHRLKTLLDWENAMAKTHTRHVLEMSVGQIIGQTS